ncbi:MAG: hypothetical protein ABI205_04845 [Gemmatimonadaceae bacterium]
MHLIADVLDQQLLDCNNVNAGRIDGIILELRDDRPPRLACVEVSPITLLGRFSYRLAAWYSRHDAKLGAGRGAPYRIPWSRVQRNGTSFQMDLDVHATPINALEDWLERTIVRRIPGG